MVGKSFMQSAALAVLAAVGAMSVPAQAQEQNQERQEARAAMREARQAQRAERQASQQTPQQAPVARGWNRGGGDGQARIEARQQRAVPEGGWRSQRSADGQRYGRNWDNGGAVSRPAPAWNGATPQVPQRGTADQARSYDGNRASGGWTQRNRTYADPNRSTTYGGYRDGAAQNWRDRQGDRTTTYRDGRTADTYRDRRDQTPAYRQGYSSASRDYRRWDRNDWRRDNRYNWSGYRNQHRDLYRAGRYYSPYNNYRYSRLNIGFFLQPLFYSQNYWIDDPYQYRLPEAYGPYRWVRYYDDALLVDIYSGEVVDVIHDFFW
jgi:hypothetical protein